MSVYAMCDECDIECDHVVCGRCAKVRGPDAMREWLTKERLKAGSDVTPEIAAIVERCADDLEAG